MRVFSSFGLLGIASCWNDYEGYQKISIDFKSADLGKNIVTYLETLPSYGNQKHICLFQDNFLPEKN